MPCQLIKPQLEEFSAQFADKMVFVYVDCEVLAGIEDVFEVTSMPTFKIFRGRDVVDTAVGTKIENIKEFIEKNA